MPHISLPSMNTVDKRILVHRGLERQKRAINGLFFIAHDAEIFTTVHFLNIILTVK
jgi:hypothetical protein